MRPTAVQNAVDRFRNSGNSDRRTTGIIVAYLQAVERERDGAVIEAKKAWSIRAIEEAAFQRRLAELKATQAVKVVHGGKIS